MCAFLAENRYRSCREEDEEDSTDKMLSVINSRSGKMQKGKTGIPLLKLRSV